MFKKVSVLFFSTTLLSACQGAYNTSTGPAQPVLDNFKAQEEQKEISPVTSGGILMRRTNQEAWQAPKREVDRVREELTQLKRDLGTLYTAQEQRLAQKFENVEGRVKEMRQQEMKDAAQDAELLALVKEKFDSIDENISYLKANEATDRQQQETLLSVLDQKFSRVEERMQEIDFNAKDTASTQRQEVQRILETLEIETLRRTSAIEQEVISMQEEKDRLLNALDQKFTEVEEKQLELTDAIDTAEAKQSDNVIRFLERQANEESKRRKELLAFVETSTKRTTDAEVEAIKRKAVLEQKISMLKDRLNTLEEEDLERNIKAEKRQNVMQEKLEKRLLALEEEYSRKISELEQAKAVVDGKLAALNEKEVVKLQEKSDTIQRRMGEISAEENIYREELSASEEKTEEMKKVVEAARTETQKLEAALRLEAGNLSPQELQSLKVARDRQAKLLNEQQALLSERVQTQRSLKKRLDDIRTKYLPEMKKLLAQKTSLEQRLKDADVDTVMALRDERDAMFTKISGLESEHKGAIVDAKKYRTALEDKRYSIEFARGLHTGSKLAEQPKTVANVQTASADIVTSVETTGSIKLTGSESGGALGGLSADEWISLSDYQVVVHDDEKRLKDIVGDVVKRAEPFTGPWEVKWKLRAENMDVITEKFSLDVETDFNSFASYLSNYMKGYRGFPLTFNLFNSERVLVVTDEQF